MWLAVQNGQTPEILVLRDEDTFFLKGSTQDRLVTRVGRPIANQVDATEQSLT